MPITIYYWPMHGRAGAAFRILDYAGIEYEHKSEFPEIASVGGAFGAASTTFAPPILVDGDYTVSQSTAVAMYCGQKAGILEGVDTFKAMQILADLIDTFEGCIGTHETAVQLKGIYEGDRLPKLLANLERNIQGPYFFGEKPSVPDFVLAALVDWAVTTKGNVLKEKTGISLPFEAGKVGAVVTAIRGLESYAKNTIPLAKPDYIKGPDDEFFAGL